MAQPRYTVSIRCKFAWWFWPYFHAIRAYAIVTGRVPSYAHIQAVTRRALKTRVVDQPEA